MQFEVVTPKGSVVKTEADAVIAPGAAGEFGVLPHHSPMVSALKPGTLSWRSHGNTEQLRIGAGVCEVRDDRVIIATESTDKIGQ